MSKQQACNKNVFFMEEIQVEQALWCTERRYLEWQQYAYHFFLSLIEFKPTYPTFNHSMIKLWSVLVNLKGIEKTKQ